MPSALQKESIFTGTNNSIDDLEMLLATYKKDKSRFDDVVKALVENKRGGNDYKSVLEILNIYQAVGDILLFYYPFW